MNNAVKKETSKTASDQNRGEALLLRTCAIFQLN